MLLKRIEIDNYKSLRGIVVEPMPLSALVGPNAAGKTNFCEALDFLAHVYQWGLEEAVSFKGGYENICYHDNRGISKEPIRFRVVLEVPMGRRRPVSLVDHVFELVPRKDPSSFLVISEDLTVSSVYREVRPDLSFSRRGKKIKHIEVAQNPRSEVLTSDVLKKILEMSIDAGNELSVSEVPAPWGRVLDMLKSCMEAVRIFQINARESRTPGVPMPRPNLERFGGNLPAVVLHLKRSVPKAYARILDALKSVVPDIEDLDAVVTHTKTLALAFHLRGTSEPWFAEDVSDGTIQALALLTAVFDPRTSLLILEEPENNVHPWAIRSFAEAFRTASATKQILLTTHSPVLVDQLKPEEIWIVQRPGTITKIDPVLTLDPSLKKSWERGRFTLSEYLDSGALPEAVPAAS
jgi:predicted ATPase